MRPCALGADRTQRSTEPLAPGFPGVKPSADEGRSHPRDAEPMLPFWPAHSPDMPGWEGTE
jgi:hypothetical protein